jgi:deoxyribodipyrimidine photo-lyase
MTAIWWIRRDVRLHDNQALHAALDHSSCVVPLFVLDPALLDSPYASERRTRFLMAGLHELNEQLQERGSRLYVRKGDPRDVIPHIVRELDEAAVFAERDYSPYATQRDQALLENEHVTLTLTDGATIRPVGSVLKDDGTPYTVFTPYSRRWKDVSPITDDALFPMPASLKTPPRIESEPLPTATGDSISELFPPGETAALARLANFASDTDLPLIYDYAKVRDRPDLCGTSQLSPYLRFGMLSARQAAATAHAALQNAPTESARAGIATWRDELIWRDFYMTILHYFPHVRDGNFRADYDGIAWQNNEDDFATWCEGRTGYPFIDAAMRQLRTSGWMHNRARMAVASFLVKDLLIDWRWGERWFMQQLLDGDPAANNGGWQWSAGTGTDAAPYFRIFNPVSQGTKHDPKGQYVRRYVPELRNVPDHLIHEPWKMKADQQRRAGCILGDDYPHRMVDHKEARQRTLAAYKSAREA